MIVRRLFRRDIEVLLGEFVEMTRDVVDDGASLGWASPMDGALAARYWKGRARDVADDAVVLFGGLVDGRLVASVQLERGHFPQSVHRAEVAKLMVRTAYRRRGIARRLMESAETFAAVAGITTILLDTRPGEPVEHLYRSIGYVRTGYVPNAIRGPRGDMQDTIYYYKLLGDV